MAKRRSMIKAKIYKLALTSAFLLDSPTPPTIIRWRQKQAQAIAYVAHIQSNTVDSHPNLRKRRDWPIFMISIYHFFTR